MADLEHLASEFEKLHDAMPAIVTELAVVKEWQRTHPDTHRLEAIALAVAKAATDERLHSMNEMRKQIDNERGTFITRELYDREHFRLITEVKELRAKSDNSSGEKGALELAWPFLLAVGTFIAGHMVWK